MDIITYHLKHIARQTKRIFRLAAALLPIAMLGCPNHGYAVDTVAPAANLPATPTVWRITSETLKLPGAEKMGMVAGDLLFDVNDRLRLGVGTYGAVRGARGGFITLGLAGEARQRLASSWVGHTGLFVGGGGGGGRGGYQLAGGGLMLRGDAGLTYETAGYGDFGFGISHVRFPSGVIISTQPYIQYDYLFNSMLNPGWDITIPPVDARMPAVTTPFHTSEFSVAGFNYRIPASVVLATGQPQSSSMQLLGVEWTSYLDDNWFLKLQSAGAMGGQNNGYMQILAGGGYRIPVVHGTALKFSAGAGPAGGGGVDTGGGLLLDAGVSLQQSLTRRIAMELAVGQVRAPSQSFRARSVSIKANYRFDLPDATSGSVTAESLSDYDAVQLRVRVANQTYFKAAPQWRNQFVDQPVNNLGIQLDYFLSPRVFVTGQGLAAYGGKAGAYMTGQVGIGIHQTVSEDFFTEAEMLLGAAGGGGLSVGGGLVGQANASVGYQFSRSLSLLASAGRIESVSGTFKANVVGLSLAYQFTGFIIK